MGLLKDIKTFLGKYINNPLIIAGIGYVVYKMIASKKESFEENIRILYTEPNYEIIFDTETNSYILIDGTNIINKVIPVKSLSVGKDFIKRLRLMKKTNKEFDTRAVMDMVEDEALKMLKKGKSLDTIEKYVMSQVNDIDNVDKIMTRIEDKKNKESVNNLYEKLVVKEAFDMAKVEEINKTKKPQKIDGVMIDADTALAIVRVYDTLSEENRKRFMKLDIKQAALTAFKLM